MYNVLIDQRTLTMLIIGLSAIGLLLFFGGYLTGYHSNASAAPSDVSSGAASPQGASAPEAGAPGAANTALAQPGGAPGATTSAPPDPAPTPQTVVTAPSSAESLPGQVVTPVPISLAGDSTPESTASSGEEATGSAPGLAADASSPDAASAPATESAPAATRAFSLQVGAYFIEEHKDSAVADLQSRGYDPVVVPVKSANGQEVFTVRIGSYATREAAEIAKAEYESAQGTSVFIRTAEQ